MTIANGTAIPAMSRPRNSAVTISSWISGGIAPALRGAAFAQLTDFRDQGAAQRDAQRGYAQHHRKLRQPQGRGQVGRRQRAETPGGQLETGILPGDQQAGGEREQVEDDVRDGAPPRREPGLEKFDLVE